MSPPTLPDAESLYQRLLEGVRPLMQPGTELLGVWSGGAWLAERLAADLGRPGAHGVISSTLHRDDFGARGLAAGTDPTRLPYAVEDADILLIDDVLYTGRTIRAVLNELFDFGRPARVRLAVLVDRGGRELPIEASFVAARLDLPAQRKISLTQAEGGRLQLQIQGGSDIPASGG